MTSSYFVPTAIPFANAAPHLGHALELILADVLARHHRGGPPEQTLQAVFARRDREVLRAVQRVDHDQRLQG